MPSPTIVHPARPTRVIERPLALRGDAREIAWRLRRPGAVNLILDGEDPERPAESWQCGPLVALAPAARVLAARAAEANDAIAELSRQVGARRARGGSARTGIAAVVSYEAGRAVAGGTVAPPSTVDPVPAVVAFDVDRTLSWTSAGEALLTVAGGTSDVVDRLAGSILDRVARAGSADPPGVPLRAVGRPRTSLPREAYLDAAARVLGHIRRGDIYQANLCQRFEVAVAGDPFAWHRVQATRFPAPRSAWAELPGVALASASPETFLRAGPDGAVETWPIKGTRPRDADPATDDRVARELLASDKDRAELLMIVDLERNDLGRVCRVGSVDVPELAVLRRYVTVHHLAARVTGRLEGGVDVATLLRATFPGGSITGAPKRRAMELLADIEPVSRGWFTGSLFWFADDGSTDSSILIRSPVFVGGRALIGAGGGIVADSDPESEWHESNHKARAASRLLGFDPEEALGTSR